MPERYELNNPPVVAETVDGEAVAIDLKTGRYYSIEGVATVVWDCLLAGFTQAEILAAAPGADETVLREFTGKLLAEGLIRSSTRAKPDQPLAPFSPWKSGELVFESFNDMEDMLTLDPIHQIDADFGWPRRNK